MHALEQYLRGRCHEFRNRGNLDGWWSPQRQVASNINKEHELSIAILRGIKQLGYEQRPRLPH